MNKPRIALIPGDPSGIGPELVARLLSRPEAAERADILLIGDAHVVELGQAQAGAAFATRAVDAGAGDWTRAGAGEAAGAVAFHENRTIGPGDFAIAEVSAASGRSALRNLDLALDFAVAGVVDAVLFAPFNKASLHAAGMGHDDELHYVAERLGVTGYISELNTLDGIWTSRVTSHVPLRAVADIISQDRVREAVMLIDRTLRRAGTARPRIAVAALNPHAGDGGNFGREEIEVIGPAVRSLADRQLAVDGPWPSDTVFLKAVAGEVDAVVTMYHDQGQIALKLLGFDRGVSVLGGIPVPIATPAHGTAFDIAGAGKADAGAMLAAFAAACDMAGR